MVIMQCCGGKKWVQKPEILLSVAIAVCLVVTLTGCTYVKNLFSSEKDVEPVEVLVQNGVDAFEDGNYREAQENFQKLKDWYPFSQYVILAELKIADAHYHLEEYDDAVFAYREFIDLHPNNEAVPYALYQIGLCHFERIDTIDRDQSNTRKALDTFRQLRRQYPDSSYAEKAVDPINRCLKSLAGNEFYIGMFYFKSKHYEAALNRFRAVVVEYPDVGIHRQALEYIARCQSHLAEEKSTESASLEK